MNQGQNTDYWQRDIVENSVQTRNKRFYKLINSEFVSHFISKCFSIRRRDKRFIQTSLKGCEYILDLACGTGQDILAHYKTYGADIQGFPKERAKEIYIDAFEYAPPNYDFLFKEKIFDAIIISNLNAHVDFSTFSKILDEGIKRLNPNGPKKVILINEYDNDGFAYKFFKLFGSRKFKKLTSDHMAHYYLEYESSFLKNFAASYHVKLLSRKPLISTCVPITHVLSYIFNTDYFFSAKHLSSNARWFYLFVDFFFSQVNNMSHLFGKKHNKAFLVGYLYQLD